MFSMLYQFETDTVLKAREEEIKRILRNRPEGAVAYPRDPETTLLYRTGTLLERIGHRMKVQVAPQRRSYGGGHVG
ncbi:MAG: hypothetical protein H6642_16320 [Caldilineaceae bacterium]|nr:hypothetical protein [Caldilineaceae bacterium]